MNHEDFLQQSEAESRASSERVKQVIRESGHPEAERFIAEYEERIRNGRLALTGAQATWHSISEAQRRALKVAEKEGGSLTRIGKGYCHDRRHQPYRPILIKTVRNLIARELLACDGGALDPEAKVVITERGFFVLRHGPLPEGQRFTG